MSADFQLTSPEPSAVVAAVAAEKDGRTRSNIAAARGIIGSGGKDRQKDDFYATGPEAVHAVADAEQMAGEWWEPACGQGHISKVLIERGCSVVSTDLVDRGYGEPRNDFLMEWKLRAPNIITNPPFKLANDFIAHAKALRPNKIIFLMRLNALEGVARLPLFREPPLPLARVHVFSYRIRCFKDGIETDEPGMMAYAWFVFEENAGIPSITWLEEK